MLIERGVFSSAANMSRLKAQLGVEASKYLNVLTIRRYIVADMKGDTIPDEVENQIPVLTNIPKLSFKAMVS